MNALPMLPTLTMDGAREDWICVCGNQSHIDGFFCCDPCGNEIEEPTEEAWGPDYLMVCGRCENIIRMV